MNVVGLRKVNFKAENGDQISGIKVFCTYEDEHIQGVGCESFFLTDRKLPDVPLDLGDEIRVVYNKYGKVDHVELV